MTKLNGSPRENSFKIAEAHPIHDALAIQKLVEKTMPTAYQSAEYGYSHQQLLEYLITLRGTYTNSIAASVIKGDPYYIAGRAAYFNRTSPNNTIEGLCKTTTNDEFSAFEIDEILVDPDCQSSGRGRGLLLTALQPLAENELVVGRILGYNERSLALAGLLGMQKIAETHAWPFPRKRSLKKMLQAPPEWSYYGAEVGIIKERLAEEKK